ncbi:MAG: (2Fe-2S) ferredoxin domain-containing protein [Planctomycetes bacterium]|nr:(2Fe-2S) ferredoxin domain-containing protein [Planctomycetota bacterium]MCB9903550.1 (2Fe-2S) ferredoxin domain-containing protein [Planctomycetota bacterium]
MNIPEKHVFVCIANRPPVTGASCGAGGSREVIDRLQFALLEHGGPLVEKVRVSGCTCLGPCEQGINMVVYPDNVWYRKVTPDDVAEIVQSHLAAGVPVERLRFTGDV